MANRDNSGALFQAKKKGSDKAPDYTGECVVNGVAMRIAGWRNTSAKGLPYLSLKFQDDRDPHDREEPARKEPADTIPF